MVPLGWIPEKMTRGGGDEGEEEEGAEAGVDVEEEDFVESLSREEVDLDIEREGGESRRDMARERVC